MYEQFKSEVLAKLVYMSGDDLQQMLGHANIAMTMIHAEVNQDSVHAANLRCVI